MSLQRDTSVISSDMEVFKGRQFALRANCSEEKIYKVWVLKLGQCVKSHGSWFFLSQKKRKQKNLPSYPALGWGTWKQFYPGKWIWTSKSSKVQIFGRSARRNVDWSIWITREVLSKSLLAFVNPMARYLCSTRIAFKHRSYFSYISDLGKVNEELYLWTSKWCLVLTQYECESLCKMQLNDEKISNQYGPNLCVR